MYFTNRSEAGKLLSEKLGEYRDQDVVVYGLPRGGVVTALEIARYLCCPLSVIIARKIGHPDNPEYAIAATTENGQIVGDKQELDSVDKRWLAEEINMQRQEAARRREKFLQGRAIPSAEGRIAILVDDGVATGFTIQAGIIELKHHKPKKLVVAVPIVPRSTARILKSEVDELVTLEIPPEGNFLGAVGDYYHHFPQVEDQEVIKILDDHAAWLQRKREAKDHVYV